MTAASSSPAALPSTAAALRWLAAHPFCLLAVLLALNALARPYAGFWHDARLYSAQVVNRAEPGCYADDLFFRYGSQDEFSIFSRLAAPLAAQVGIEVTFFGLFLVFNALLLFAVQRFVLALVADRTAAVLALVFLAVAPLSYSGLSVLQVQEPFLTPRALANALTLFGLERLLRHHYVAAFSLVVLAVPVHPIMALAGLLVWPTYLAFTVLRPRLSVGLLSAAVVLGLVVVLYEPLGTRLFGTMDAEWRETIRAATIFNFPLEWDLSDWLNQAVSFGVLIGAAGWLPSLDAPRRRFALALVVVGAAGLAGTLVGSLWPYALLFQGQPARVLWLLKVTQVALGFALIAAWGRDPNIVPRLAALALATFFCVTSYLGVEFFLLGLAVPFCCLAHRGLERAPRRADWPWHAARASLVIGVALWVSYKWFLLFALRERLPPLGPLDFVEKLHKNLAPVLYLVLFLLVVRRLNRHGGWTAPRLAAVALTFALAWQTCFFATATVPVLRAASTRDDGDVALVRDYLARQRSGRRTPTVYCALGCVNYLWIDWHAQSYFDWNQIVGVMFNRQTAQESRRRALLVRAFELERVREHRAFLSRDARTEMRLLYQADFDYPAPALADLRRLCQEPGLDFLVLTQNFPSVPAARCGRLFVYDCRQVRAALHLTGAPAPLAAAGGLAPGIP